MVKVALLIGVSKYEPGLNPLPCAVKDVRAMQQVLEHPEIGEFTDVTVLEDPAKPVMEEAIEVLFAERQKDDLVLLFFSGHGIKDDTGRLYLATSTTRKTPRGDLIRSSALPANFVHESMSRSRSKRLVVILDSCFSGAFAEGLSAKDDGTVNIREQLGGEGRAILTSSTSTQYSFEKQGLDLSVYTCYLIEGITTGAADLDGDEVVSIDELHEYAKTKVGEIQPEMKPEIYTSREGFKIRLSKVPPGDPKQKYRKEVARYSDRGDVSFVGRKILDALRIRLGLSEAQAIEIEDEILAVARQEFREKLQQYERDFAEALQQEVPLIPEDINALRQNLQQILGLRNEDTMPIEARVTARIEDYKQHLQQYEQALAAAMRQQYPLNSATRHRLQQMQQEWQLTHQDLASIESRVSAEVEAYRQKLQLYEGAFTTATQQEYPLSEAKRNALRHEQQILGLNQEDIAPIEVRITAEIEAYQQKLQEYEQAFNQAIQYEYPLKEQTREELKRYQHVLKLGDEEVARIEEKLVLEFLLQRQFHQPVQEQKGQTATNVTSTQKSFNQRAQILSTRKNVKVPLQLVSLALVVLGGVLLGYYLFQQKWVKEALQTPSATPPPSVITTPKPRLGPEQFFETKSEITLKIVSNKNKTSEIEATAPPGSVLLLMSIEPDEQTHEDWVHLRVCSIGKSKKPPLKPGDKAKIILTKFKSSTFPARERVNGSPCQSSKTSSPAPKEPTVPPNPN